MELIVIWLCSIVMCFLMNLVNDMRIFKDAADAGFRLDFSKISNTSSITNSHIKLLIPFLNIYYVLNNAFNYSIIKTNLLSNLNQKGALIPLRPDEQATYNARPTSICAFLLYLKFQLDLEHALRLEINIGQNTGEIFYLPNYHEDEIIILKSTGIAEALPLETQKEYIYTAWQKIILEAMGTATPKEPQNLTIANEEELLLALKDELNSKTSSKPLQLKRKKN